MNRFVCIRQFSIGAQTFQSGHVCTADDFEAALLTAGQIERVQEPKPEGETEAEIVTSA